jgi:nucleoside phosphorylase
MTSVVVLAPMPMEMDAIVTAFGLTRTPDTKPRTATGRVGAVDVTAVHIGMGPPLTRAALNRIFDDADAEGQVIDHVMIAGICGGLDPDLPIGTMVNPEVVVDHTSGASYRHRPPGDEPLRGRLVTTEGVSFDVDLSTRFFADGCLGVDMETSAVAEVCEARGRPWSVYRCISDRHVDGLLDERIVKMTNPDGSGNVDEMRKLIEADPELGVKLAQLARDTTLAARLAAEAAVRGCLALRPS